MNLRCPTSWSRARHYSPAIACHVSDVDATLDTYANGGYPLYYLVETPQYGGGTSKECMCPTCASSLHEHGDEQARVTAADINWEDKEFYCDCGERIPSAYAEEG
jgi:hypothetical protein